MRKLTNSFGISRQLLAVSTTTPLNLDALVGERELAIELIRNRPLHRNYRWLVSNPHIASLRDEPCFREVLYEFYPNWQRDLADLGPSLPVALRSYPRLKSI